MLESGSRWIVSTSGDQDSTIEAIRIRGNSQGGARVGDIIYIIGLIVFFVLAVLYVAALERV
jgi:hypothetical protein